MPTFISILRGINVSGQKKIRMADLKTLYEKSGFKEVLTYIQSGNVIFKNDKKTSIGELVKKIEQAIIKQYGFEVPVIIRTAEEMNKIFTTNPFIKTKGFNIEKLHVTFLAQQPEPLAIKITEGFDFSPDKFIICGTEVFLHIPESYGETKLSNKFFESKLKGSATTRNWKTVTALTEMSNGLATK